jgi:hypothetical protein
MDNKELREHLLQIHDEIEVTRTVDEKGKELLQDLDEDIRALLARSGANHIEINPPIITRLQGALDHFEITHPDLTLLISKLLESLSNAGI